MKKISLYLCISILFAACNNEEEIESNLYLHLEESEVIVVHATGGEYKIPVSSNSDWQVETTAQWLKVNTQEGHGNDTLYLFIQQNPTTDIRKAQLNIKLKANQQQAGVTIQQQVNTDLIGIPGIEKGAGFSYDVLSEYCQGMRYQIFNLTRMDYLQQIYGKTYVMDDYSTQMEEEYQEGKTEKEISQKFSANASIGLDLLVFNADISAGFSYSQLSAEKTVFGMKRSKRIVYSRDIQYQNILASVLSEEKDSTLFSPGFLKDWKKLQSINAIPGEVPKISIYNFIDKWGICFVARSVLGGTIDYEMEIDETVIGKELGIGGAVEASLCFIINADASVKYAETMKKIKGRYRYCIRVRGGSPGYVSILNTGGTLDTKDYTRWLNSLNLIKQGNTFVASEKVALIDVKLVSIAELFTGKVKTALTEYINQINN